MNFKKIFSLVTLSLCSLSLQAEETKKPNIIFIMADDLGIGEIGCYGFNDIIKTPQIDNLAKEGTMFTQAYTGSPVCGPSRCVLQTGKHSGHARRRDNTSKDGKGTLIPLKDEDYTIAEMRKIASYSLEDRRLVPMLIHHCFLAEDEEAGLAYVSPTELFFF